MQSAIRKSNIVEGIENVTHLAEGGYSNTYRLDTRKDSYVIKIRTDNLVWRLQREYTLLSHKEVAKRELGPKIYRFDESGSVFKLPYLLEEYVEGTHPKGNWGKKSRIDPPFIRAIAKWYRQLHSITIKGLKNDDPAIGVFDWEDEVRRINSITYYYTGNPDGIQPDNNPGFSDWLGSDEGELLSAEVLAICKENDSILKRDEYNLIQCDPNPDNIFIQENGRIKLVDWDFAGYHVFERDLAQFFNAYNLTREEEALFLESYGIQPDAAFLRKLNIMKLVHSAGECLDPPPWFSKERVKKQIEKNLETIREIQRSSKHLEATRKTRPAHRS
jgi:thiamine kinase-like enzyme